MAKITRKKNIRRGSGTNKNPNRIRMGVKKRQQTKLKKTFKKTQLKKPMGQRVRKRRGAVVSATRKNPKQSLAGAQKRRIVGDARQKLNFKLDARDILTNRGMGQHLQDARERLERRRRARNGITTATGVSFCPISANIVRKTDRNGKISLMTAGGNLASSVATLPGGLIGLALQRELGLTSPTQAPLPQQRHINTAIKWTRSSSGAVAAASQLIRETLKQNEDVEMMDVGPVPTPPRSRPPLLPATLRSRLDTGPTPPIRQQLQPPPAPPPVPQTVTHGIFGRRAISSSSTTHNQFAAAAIKQETATAYRILVSNLQSTVTEDDIKELFEDIGELVAARFLHPGTAEVIYKSLKDAQKAVDTYHNRQLDGHPMKCIQKGTILVPISKVNAATNQSATGINGSGNSKLTPDLQTIHRVLFNRN